MLKTVAGVLALAFATSAYGQVSQERLDLAMVKRIREEGLERSRIEELAGHLTDVIGPRLTGSPQMKQANEWTAATFRQWGLQNVVVEPWGEFGRGWERVSYSGRVVTPYAQPLDAISTAWTGSTKGTVTGRVVLVEIRERGDVEKYRAKLKGAIVARPGTTTPDFVEFAAPPRRYDADSMQTWTTESEYFPIRRPARPAPQPGQTPAPAPDSRAAAAALNLAVDSLLSAEGAIAVLRPSMWAYSVLRLGGSTAGRNPLNPVPLPELIVSAEQFAQIYRNVKRGLPVTVELNVQNRFHTTDLKAYNTLAELPGTDKADEFVMLGAHLDSWHGGTGATDNASGSVVMMEALRILKELDVKPRRTIRIALWSGEEQGLLGSRNWLENHKELHAKISAYVNVDNGTGRIRGIWDQDNELAIPVFQQILWPFRDLGVTEVEHGNTTGTDHQSFVRHGIPGFNFIQDPIEYGIRTHHSNVDTFDHMVIADLKQAAVIVAATVYHLAMRAEMMPRKPAPETTSSN